MSEAMPNLKSIDTWLEGVREYIAVQAPEILGVLDLYMGEARFGRKYIDSDLATISSTATILEVGAGSLLLSCQLVREGFQVSALEPLGDGFSHFDKLRNLILEHARITGCVPTLLNLPAEKLSVNSFFDYAFSINVMEHVNDMPGVVVKVSNALKNGARYRFTCPNYLFPYEPHFNIPTLFSKKLTEHFFAGKIFGRQDVPDPVGTWKSLNWITVPLVVSGVKKVPDLHVRFNKKLLVSTIERVATDPQFSARRSKSMRTVLSALVALRLHSLFALIPATLQPIIDCTITKNPNVIGKTS